jgi:N4-gp56 family major capsid protein
MGQDAACTVPLRGNTSGYPIVTGTKPDKSDPLGQRGSVGWKFWWGGGILYDPYFARLECAATLNPTI